MNEYWKAPKGIDLYALVLWQLQPENKCNFFSLTDFMPTSDRDDNGNSIIYELFAAVNHEQLA